MGNIVAATVESTVTTTARRSPDLAPPGSEARDRKTVRAIASQTPQPPKSQITPGKLSARTDFTVDLAAIAVAMACFMLPIQLRHGPGLLDSDMLLAAIAVTTILASLYFAGAWDSRGHRARASSIGPVRRGYFWAISTLAILWLALGIEKEHLWILAALPVALAISLIARGLLATAERHGLGDGHHPVSVLVVGDRTGLGRFLGQAQHARQSHWRLDAACLTNESPGAPLPKMLGPLPVVGIESELCDIVRDHNYETVILLPSADWPPEHVRAVMWQLEGRMVEVMIAPPLVDVASTRLHVTTVVGIPLLHVAARQRSTPAHAAKMVVDRVAAFVGILLLLPLLTAVALCIRLTSKGPALYRQTRIGLDKQPFTIYKFRTMTHDAETMLHQIRDRNDGSGPLFKCFEDPRVTRIGRMLRKYSVDELPQLFNVALGSMSLIGPRPPLPGQVEQYDQAERRRLLVRPGMTGLWQVSGRSNLSWSETVRHDLYYVENWSIRLDAEILLRTAGAVTSGRGAY